MRKNSKIFVISGPSGVGKGTLVRNLLTRVPNLYYSVSATTRPLRKGEIPGKNYFFLKKKEFETCLKNQEFLEWAKVYNHYYGTFYTQIKKGETQGKDVILELDPQGARQIKKRLPQAINIFILPPSLAELKKRLQSRSRDSEKIVNLRFQKAQKEMEEKAYYDYQVINDKIERATTALKEIIDRERKKEDDGGDGLPENRGTVSEGR